MRRRPRHAVASAVDRRAGIRDVGASPCSGKKRDSSGSRSCKVRGGGGPGEHTDSDPDHDQYGGDEHGCGVPNRAEKAPAR